MTSPREIVVRALPDELPDALEIDVSELAVGETVNVSDLVAPIPTIRFFTDYAITPRVILRLHAGFLDLEVGDSVVVLEASTYDGTDITGQDFIRIVPD